MRPFDGRLVIALQTAMNPIPASPFPWRFGTCAMGNGCRLAQTEHGFSASMAARLAG